MVDATKLADLAHLFRRIGTRVTVLPVKNNASVPSVPHSSRHYQWEQMFVAANGNGDDDDGSDDGKRKHRPEQRTQGTTGGDDGSEPQQKMPRLAPPDQETTEMVADWMTQLEGMPPEIQMLILQFVLRPRFMPTYRRVGVSGERWERVDLEVRQNHAMLETKRLMRAFLALRQTSRYWRSLLLDTSLRIAMYLDWVRSPVMPLWLDTSLPDDKGIYAGRSIRETAIPDIRETMPELRADVPSTPAWYSTYLANLILHQFMQEQHRDLIKYRYEKLVDKSQLRSPHTIFKGSQSTVYWDGRLRDAEIVKTYIATPGSSELDDDISSWTLEESYYDRERPPSGTPPGGDSIDEGVWRISLPGFFFETGPWLEPGIRREEVLAWWPQIPITASPFPIDLIHRKYISFIHYSFIASSVIRIPVSVFPAIRGSTVATWVDEEQRRGAAMSVNLHFRRTLFLDYPIRVDENGMAPLLSDVARSIVPDKYVLSMVRPRPYRRIVLKNVRIGSVRQLGWTLSFMAYSMGDGGYWFDVFATTSKRQQKMPMVLYVTKDTYLDIAIDTEKRLFHSLNINRDPGPVTLQPLDAFEADLSHNGWIVIVGASSENDPELEQLPAWYRRLYKAYQPLAPGGDPDDMRNEIYEPQWLAEIWLKSQSKPVVIMFLTKAHEWRIDPHGNIHFRSKEARERRDRLLATWQQETKEALQKYIHTPFEERLQEYIKQRARRVIDDN